MRKIAVPLLAAFVACLAACGPRPIPAPVVTAPRYPDFVAPVVPRDLATSRAVVNQDRGWRFLQAGDLRNAEREFQEALKASAAFYPAESGLGYLELSRKDGKAALARFDRALGRAAGDVSALAGRGLALESLGRDADALAAFERALAADPTLADVRRRVEVLRFRSAEQGLVRARAAAKAGRLEEAIAAYRTAIASSPDSAFLYRELAGVYRQGGDGTGALEALERAVTLDPADAHSFAEIGDIHAEAGEYDAAIQAYGSSLALEPSEAVQRRLDAVRQRAERASLPEEYRAIDALPQITRADLAALVGVRLPRLLQVNRRREAVLITDVRTNWAAAWIMAVARAGVMDAYANHTFQPRAPIRRSDLAQVVSRLLPRAAVLDPALANRWASAPRTKFSDLASGHLAYQAASMAVASGVMTTGADGAFQPTRPVSGADAIEAIARIEALLPPAPAANRIGR